MSKAPHLRVVAAVIGRSERYLITQRRPSAVLPGLWEFPGGRVEEGESDTEALRREVRERVGVEVDIEPRQPRDDLAQALDAAQPLLPQERVQSRRADVEKVAEHVNVVLARSGGDLDAGHEGNAGRLARGGRGGRGADRVVIGHPEHRHAGGGRAGDELGRRAPPVGRRRVRVKIDQWVRRLREGA